MSTLQQYDITFPKIPSSTKNISSLSLRSFGISENDLEINFNNLQPYLVTDILQCCTQDRTGKIPDKTFFWNLTIGKRIECLLTIATSGKSNLSVNLRCLNQNCQKQMEIEILLDNIFDLQHDHDDVEHLTVEAGNENILIRKPTGKDQLEWLTIKKESKFADFIIEKLIVNETKYSVLEQLLKNKLINEIDKRLTEFDPLVNFYLTVSCPYCKFEGDYEINLEKTALLILHKTQQQLVHSIHRIALHYHWTEQQIFSLPPWRRSYYLALIEKEKNQ